MNRAVVSRRTISTIILLGGPGFTPIGSSSALGRGSGGNGTEFGPRAGQTILGDCGPWISPERSSRAICRVDR